MTRARLRPRPGPQPPPAQSSATPPPATPSPPAKPALAVPVGLCWRRASLSLALVLQSSYGGGAPPFAAARFNAIIAAGKSAVPAQPAPSTVQWPRLRLCRRKQRHRQHHRRRQHSWLRPHPAGRRAGSTRSASRSNAVAANDRARSRESGAQPSNSSRTNQQQMASDNAKAIGELKASQEEMKRALAKVPDQAPPKRHVIAAGAARHGLAQAGARRAAAGESAA